MLTLTAAPFAVVTYGPVVLALAVIAWGIDTFGGGR